jgi:hypothetical protein
MALPAPSDGQARLTGADLTGVVTDESGGVLPGTTVLVTNTETNAVRTATTDERGQYYVAALPPGTYRIDVTLSGFAPRRRDSVVLQIGQSATFDVVLNVAGTTAEVSVTAEAPLVQANRTEISSVVSQQQIEDLPINGRNFISFSVITAGVTTDRTPQQGASATSGLSFAGQRARSNNIMVDGLDNNDQVVGAVRATFSQEAVREFQVLTNSYSAEFGKAAGGVVNIVTKSGTNEFRGNAFAYFRDDALNAKGHFEQYDIFGTPVNLEKAPFKQRQWGGTLGGPIRRDRTFFFGSIERTDIQASNLVNIQPAAAAVLNTLGFPVELGNVPYTVERTEALGKVDHQWTSSHVFVTRVNFSDITNENIEPFGGSVARSRGAVQLRTDWSFSASQTDIVSARMVNEFRAQFAPQEQDINSLDPLCGGPCLREDQGGPTLEIAGVASVGRQRFTPQPRRNSRLQFVETFSYMSGRHHVKAGADVNYIRSSKGALPLHFGGRYVFSAVPALGITSAFDALKLGLPAAYVQGYGNSSYPYDSGDLSVFVQDEWKIGRLVLKPGVRYQRQFWPDMRYDVSDVGGSRLTYAYPTDGNNVAPRLAAAYDLTNDGRTPVHASYGVYYDNTLTTVGGVTQILDGLDNVRTLVLTLGQRCGGIPCTVLAWNAPGHQLASEDAAKALVGGTYPTLAFGVDPALRNPYAHQAAVGFERALAGDVALSANLLYVRGFDQVGTIDYNPVVPALGTSRRPNDLPCSANPAAPCIGGGIPGSSASVLQYTSFGESWYKGVTLSLNKRFTGRHQFLASYTASKAEDNSTDYQSNFIPQNNGRGRNPDDTFGLPLGFDPASERGPATHDQRHRLVLSGVWVMPSDVGLSMILTAASGRPYTPLAGLDLNADGNGGAFPTDRARRNPLDESTSVGRNSETTAAAVNVDLRLSKKFTLARGFGLEAMLDVFNLFNRVNFFEDTNQSSFAIFGNGAYPASPLPTYGKYTLTLPPRQVQFVVKVRF